MIGRFRVSRLCSRLWHRKLKWRIYRQIADRFPIDFEEDLRDISLPRRVGTNTIAWSIVAIKNRVTRDPKLQNNNSSNTYSVVWVASSLGFGRSRRRILSKRMWVHVYIRTCIIPLTMSHKNLSHRCRSSSFSCCIWLADFEVSFDVDPRAPGKIPEIVCLVLSKAEDSVESCAWILSSYKKNLLQRPIIERDRIGVLPSGPGGGGG